jgi:hypothetical protein
MGVTSEVVLSRAEDPVGQPASPWIGAAHHLSTGEARHMPDNSERQKQPTLHDLPAGMRVEVRCSYEGSWSRGFEIAEVVLEQDGVATYRLRRHSDGAVLPVLFPACDIMPAGR